MYARIENAIAFLNKRYILYHVNQCCSSFQDRDNFRIFLRTKDIKEEKYINTKKGIKKFLSY